MDKRLTDEELDQALRRFAQKLRRKYGVQVEYRITLNINGEWLEDDNDNFVHAMLAEVVEAARRRIHQLLKEHLTLGKVIRVAYERSDFDIDE